MLQLFCYVEEVLEEAMEISVYQISLSIKRQIMKCRGLTVQLPCSQLGFFEHSNATKV